MLNLDELMFNKSPILITFVWNKQLTALNIQGTVVTVDLPHRRRVMHRRRDPLGPRPVAVSHAATAETSEKSRWITWLSNKQTMNNHEKTSKNMKKTWEKKTSIVRC